MANRNQTQIAHGFQTIHGLLKRAIVRVVWHSDAPPLHIGWEEKAIKKRRGDAMMLSDVTPRRLLDLVKGRNIAKIQQDLPRHPLPKEN